MIDIETIKLAKGAHSTPEEGMCVMEMTAYLAHEPHSDSPTCASPVIAAFLRRWNDDLDDATRQKLKPYAAKVIGTAAGKEIEDRRAWMLCDWLIRHYTPAWLDLAGLGEQANALRGLAEVADLATVMAARPAIALAKDRADEAWAAAWDAARAAARVAAWDAAGAAAWDAAGAAAGDAAGAAAKKKLAPTVQGLQASAFELLDRMIALGGQKPKRRTGRRPERRGTP